MLRPLRADLSLGLPVQRVLASPCFALSTILAATHARFIVLRALRHAVRAVFALALLSTAPLARGADLEDGEAAYQRGDYASAMRLWRRSADDGNARAQFKLGLLYRYGLGVAQDYEQAVSWYRKAAAQGLASAQNDLGRMYEYGYGVAQDYVKAIACYRKAAEQEYGNAQYSVVIMCHQGGGIGDNIVRRCEAAKQACCD